MQAEPLSYEERRGRKEGREVFRLEEQEEATRKSREEDSSPGSCSFSSSSSSLRKKDEGEDEGRKEEIKGTKVTQSRPVVL
jgi:hypothetical protein